MIYSILGFSIDSSVNATVPLLFQGANCGLIIVSNQAVTVTIQQQVLQVVKGIEIKLLPSTLKINNQTLSGKLKILARGVECITNQLESDVLIAEFNFPDHDLDNRLSNLILGIPHFRLFVSRAQALMDIKRLVIDMKNGFITTFFPGVATPDPTFLIGDMIKGGTTSVMHTSECITTSVTLSNEIVNATLEPAKGFIPVQPDSFSMNINSFPTSNFTDSSIKYSFALINGSLNLDSNTIDSMASWGEKFSFKKSSRPELSPALLILHSMDEHGHPIALANNTNAKYELKFRNGRDTINSNEFTQTMKGITVAGGQDLSLRSISHKSIDFKKKQQQLIRHKNLTNKVERPYWLPDNNQVILEAEPPLALHSLTKGSWFELKKDGNGKFPSSIKASLEAELHSQSLYEFLSLNLNAQEWTLKSQYEERESKRNDIPGIASGFSFIEGRAFDGSERFSIPVTDYLFGATNIFDANGANPSNIHNFVQEKVHTLNDGILRTFTTQPLDQVHASGFRRKHQPSVQNIGVKDLFNVSPLRTTQPVELKIIPASIQSLKTAVPSPGLAPDTNVPEVQPQEVNFEHGSDSAILPDTKSHPPFLKKLQRVWNEYAFIIEEFKNQADNELFKAASAVAEVKLFLEGLQTGKKEEKIRVKAIDVANKEVYYRLKLSIIAPDPNHQGQLDPTIVEKWAEKVKAVIYGNIASLPGIGNRIFKLRKWIDDYLANNTKSWQTLLQTYWEKTWNECKEEEERILYALFDLVYKCFDRQLLDKLIAITVKAEQVTENLRKNLDILWNYIGLDQAALDAASKELIKEVGKLVTETAQGVDPYFDLLKKTWDDIVRTSEGCPGVADKIKSRYGAELNIATYTQLLKDIKEGQSPVVKEITDCLQKRFRKKLRDLFVSEFNKAVSNAKIAEFLNSFQEQVFTFYMYAERARDIFEKWKKLKQKLSNIHSAQDVKNLATDPLIAEIYPELRKLSLLLKPQLAAALKPFSEVANEIRTVLDNNRDDIFMVIGIINESEKLLADFNDIRTLVNDIKACGNDLDCQLSKAKAFFKKDHNSQLLFVISAFINEEFGPEIKSLGKEIATNVGTAIDSFIDKHFDKILLILKTIQEIKDEIVKWKTIIDTLKRELRELQHEVQDLLTRLQTAGVQKVFLDLLREYLLEKYHIDLDIANIRVEPPQYIAYGKQVNFNTDSGFRNTVFQLLERLHISKLSLCKFSDASKSWGCFLNDQSIYVLKLGNDMNLSQIIREINESNKKPGLEKGPIPNIEDIIGHLHSDIDTKLWRGLLVINPIADLSQDSLISDLIGRSTLQMPYISLSDSSDPGRDFDVYGYIKEEQPLMKIEDDQDKSDTHLALIRFEAVIKQTTLESGEALLKLKFRDVFGQDTQEELIIQGTVPKPEPGRDKTLDFEFAAILPEPREISLKKTQFLDKLTLRGIKAIRKNNESKLAINADLDFAPISFLFVSAKVSISDFYITLPSSGASSETPPGKPRGVNFDIGAIRYVIDKPRSVNIGGIEIIPHSMGYFKVFTTTSHAALLGGVLPIAGHIPTANNGKCVFINVRVEMGELPLLGGAGSNLNFEGILTSNLDSGNVFFGLKTVNADHISIDLFRFISLYIRKLIIGDVTLKSGQHATFFGVHDIKLKLLDWEPLKDKKISAFILHDKPAADGFNKTPQKGFLALYQNPDAKGFLKIYWLLVAKNIAFPENVLTSLLSPGTNSADSVIESAFGKMKNAPEMQTLETSGSNYVGNTSYNPKTGSPGSSLDLDFAHDNSWLFGISFGLAEILNQCTVVLQDKHFYGILLSSNQAWFKAFFGTDKLSLAYIPGPTKHTDKFRIELKLDRLDMFAALRSGMMAIEMAFNQDFLFDFGFPWRVGNTYMMDRTFSAGEAVEIRFGFYVQKKTEINANGSEVTIGAGLGLSYGYRIGARSRFAWAEAGIGVFMIFSGAITFLIPETSGPGPLDILKSRIKKIEATGVIGIYAYAEGGIDYWVISASIKAWIIAAIEGRLLYIPGGDSSIDFSAVLSLHYRASARVKLGFVKINVSIEGTLSYGVSGRIALN